MISIAAAHEVVDGTAVTDLSPRHRTVASPKVSSFVGTTEPVGEASDASLVARCLGRRLFAASHSSSANFRRCQYSISFEKPPTAWTKEKDIAYFAKIAAN